MRKLLSLAALVLILAAGAWANKQFPNFDDNGRYDLPFHIGVVEKWTPSVTGDVRRKIRVPHYSESDFRIGSYTAIKVDSVSNTGDFTITVNFTRKYSYPSGGGNYVHSSRAIGTGNARSSIPIPPETFGINFNIGDFTDLSGTMNTTINITLGNDLGSTMNVVTLTAGVPTLLTRDDHASYRISRGQNDFWIGEDQTVTKDRGHLVQASDAVAGASNRGNVYGLTNESGVTADVWMDW